MNPHITEDTWQKVYGKVKNLVHMISYRISGDHVLCNPEDLESELKVVVIEAINGFSKKTEAGVSEFIDSELFHKYLKTCLWNYKNNRGLKIEKKRKIRNTQSIRISSDEGSLDGTCILETIPDRNYSVSSDIEAQDLLATLSPEEKELIEAIVDNPDLIKPNGKINRLELSSSQNKTWVEVDKKINSISKKLDLDL